MGLSVPKGNSSYHGMTLVEMMIAMVLSSLIISGIYQVLSGQKQTYSVQERLNEQRQDLRAAILIMRMGMERLGYDPNCAKATPACDIPGANDNSTGYITPGTTDADDFEFKYRDGGSTKTVRFRAIVTGGNTHIKRGTTRLIKNIDSLTFRYYKRDGTEISTFPATASEWAALCLVNIEIQDSFTAFPGTSKETTYADSARASVRIYNALSNDRNPAHASFDWNLVCDR